MGSRLGRAIVQLRRPSRHRARSIAIYRHVDGLLHMPGTNVLHVLVSLVRDNDRWKQLPRPVYLHAYQRHRRCEPLSRPSPGGGSWGCGTAMRPNDGSLLHMSVAMRSRGPPAATSLPTVAFQSCRGRVRSCPRRSSRAWLRSRAIALLASSTSSSAHQHARGGTPPGRKNTGRSNQVMILSSSFVVISLCMPLAPLTRAPPPTTTHIGVPD